MELSPEAGRPSSISLRAVSARSGRVKGRTWLPVSNVGRRLQKAREPTSPPPQDVTGQVSGQPGSGHHSTTYLCETRFYLIRISIWPALGDVRDEPINLCKKMEKKLDCRDDRKWADAGGAA